MLASAKKLVPLQKEMAKYANVFKLDREASSKDLPTTFDEHLKHVQEVNYFFSEQEQQAFERTGKLNTNGPDMTVARCTRQSFQIVLDSLTCFSNTLTEVGKENLLDRICFESLTTLSVECFFKAMRADHDMPTVAGYAYKRARCVKDDMMRMYQKSFSYFTGPNSFYREKIINSEPPNMESRVTKQSVASKGSGDKNEDKRREDVMREFVSEYGKGVRQENVRSKTKEITGTLPYALSMRPAAVTPSHEVNDSVSECLIVNASNVNPGDNVRVKVLYRSNDVVAVRHNLRREPSPYWLAILLQDIYTEAESGRLVQDKMKIQ